VTFDIKNNVLLGLEDFFEERSRRFDLDLVRKIINNKLLVTIAKLFILFYITLVKCFVKKCSQMSKYMKYIEIL